MTTFSHIFGQADAIDWLSRAYLADRLPHGLIFAGPVGVGKMTTARAMAKIFLCDHPTDLSACGTCDSCVVFDGGNHPDWHVVTKELIRYHDKTGKSKGIELSINVIRPELVEPASRKAVMGRGKVFVVEQADLMNSPAQNALLKTLEEPSGRTLIILLTDQPGGLLPTIRSRCQLVRFAALDEKRSAAELVKRGVSPDVAQRATRYTEGSIGLAIKWIEDDVITRADDLSTMLAALFNGRPPGDFPGWLKAASDAYAEKQIKRDPLGSEDQARRVGIGLYLHLAAEISRKRLAELVENAPAYEVANGLDQACAVIDAVQQAEGYIDANVNVSLVFQQLAATLERVAIDA